MENWILMLFLLWDLFLKKKKNQIKIPSQAFHKWPVCVFIILSASKVKIAWNLICKSAELLTAATLVNEAHALQI